MFLKISFINKTRLILNYLIKDKYFLLIIFNKEKRGKVLILINNYFLNIKEIKKKDYFIYNSLKTVFYFGKLIINSRDKKSIKE